MRRFVREAISPIGSHSRGPIARVAVSAAAVAVATLIGILFTSLEASAQPDSPDTDSLRTDIDSTQVSDSAAVDSAATPRDTIPPYPPNGPMLGSVRTFGPQASDLDKNDLTTLLYFSLFEPMREFHPGYPLTQGAPGRRREFSYAGTAPANSRILYNGRVLPTYQLEFYPAEYFERVELLRGADAAVFGAADALTAMNVVQPKFDVDGSYVRLGYAFGNESNVPDITYSRNVAPRLNLTLGLHTVDSDPTYTNDDVGMVSVRGSLMWRPHDNLSMSITEMYTDLDRGLNGGLTDASSNDPQAASVVERTLREDNDRHDVTATAQWYPGAGPAPGDSAFESGARTRVDAAAYYSETDRHLTRNDEVVTLRGIAYEQGREVAGGRVAVYSPIGSFRLQGNAAAEYVDLTKGRLHGGGTIEFPIVDNLHLVGGWAITDEEGVISSSAIGELRASPSRTLDLRLTGRVFGDDDETDATFDTAAFIDERSRLLLEAEADWSEGNHRVRLGGYHRTVHRSALTGEGYSISGADLFLSTRLGFLRFQERAIFTFSAEEDHRFPMVISRSDLAGLFRPFNGALDLTAGLSLEVQSSFAGVRYDYPHGEWLYPAVGAAEEQPYPVLDVYAVGRIGSAYLRATFGNVLNNPYSTAYRYPVWGRSLRFGITWTMID